MPDQLAALAWRQAQEIDIIKSHTVSGDAPVVFGDAADRLSDQALTGARLTHQPTDFAFGKRNTDPVDRFHPAFAGFKFNRQIADIK
ncbi:hypothetical protein D3C76_862460 [compost metagenome]